MSSAVFRSILILLALFITLGLCGESAATNASFLIKEWGEDTIGRDESTCRFQLKKVEIWHYYIILGAISTLSIVFLGLSVGIFVYIQRYLMKEMDEAVYKISCHLLMYLPWEYLVYLGKLLNREDSWELSHDLMDAVMVSLLPNSLLDEIGAKENKKDK